MENKKTFENVENEEVVAEAPIQEKKKDKKILLVFTLLSLCVYLMVQIPLFSTIDVSGLGELGVEINKFLAESSLNLLFQGSSTLAQPGIILSSNIILFVAMLFYIGHILLNVKTKKTKLVCLISSLVAIALLILYTICALHEPILWILKMIVAPEGVVIYEFELLFLKLAEAGLTGLKPLLTTLYEILSVFKVPALIFKEVGRFGIIIVFMINYVALLFRTEIYIARKVSILVFTSLLLLVYILCYTGVNDFITNITISVLQNLFISIYKFITETVSMAEIAQDLIYFATDIMDFAIFVLPNVINFFKGLIQSTESIYILLLLIIVVITCMVQTIKFIKQTKLKGLGILLFIFIILLAGAFVVFKIFGAIASVFILLFVWLGALVS